MQTLSVWEARDQKFIDNIMFNVSQYLTSKNELEGNGKALYHHQRVKTISTDLIWGQPAVFDFVVLESGLSETDIPSLMGADLVIQIVSFISNPTYIEESLEVCRVNKVKEVWRFYVDTDEGGIILHKLQDDGSYKSEVLDYRNEEIKSSVYPDLSIRIADLYR